MYRHASTCLIGRGSSAPWRTRSGSRVLWQEGPQETLRTDSCGCPEMLSQDQHEPGMRLGLIARVRREIAAGTYDTPEKWEAALDKLLDRLDLA